MISALGFAQNQCPPNIDFEMGDFTNWVCKSGSVSYSAGNCVAGGINSVNDATIGIIAGRHTIIPKTNTGRDFYGNFPLACPNGSDYSVKLGNNTTGISKAESITYTYSIPATATNFSILYQYAVVLQDPSGTTCPGMHAEGEKPRFQAIVKSVNTGQSIGCVSFDFFAGSSLPGFQVSPNSPANSTVWYKDWTPVTLNLSNYAGQTIEIKFITSNCTRGGHFGYAYVDINATCDGAIVGTTICRGDTTLNMTAPYGFQSYAWYNNVSFSQVIGTNQILTLSPAPNAGAIYPVIVTPYPGYGCVDTLYATLTLADKPISNAGNNANVCKWQQVPLGSPPNPLYTYNWSPPYLVSDPSIANPSGFITTNTTGEFVVTTTDPASGCFSNDTVLLIPKIVDTALQVIGKTLYCANESLSTSFSLNPTATNIQWYNNTNAILGANSNTYMPIASGSYWASLTQNGCTDTTATVPFTINPLPIVSFTNTRDTGCVTNNSFVLSNTTTISSNENIDYTWSFGDNTTSNQTSPTKTYSAKGVYNVKLVATSISGCKDSTSKPLTILPNVDAAFSWDSICFYKPAVFKNLSTENGSTQVNYSWNFDDGFTSINKNPLAINYLSAGVKNIIFTATAIGCEADVQTIAKPVVVNDVKPGIRYPSITVPLGYTKEIYARDSVGIKYNWQPFNYLSNNRIKAPRFTAVNDVAYNIIITNEHECITTDTLAIKILNKKGWYLPNAFTPNGDGLNDDVNPYLIGMKGLKRFAIYNRAGQLIFATSKDGEAWDGTYKGEKLSQQAFVWVLEYYDATNNTILEKGTLMLIR